jgi:hypothetical protein
LAVSVPADPVVLTPGKTSTIRIRVLNPGTRAVTVRISGRHVDLGDNGAVAIGTSPDPLWNGRVQFPSEILTIPAMNFVNVSLTVHMPEQLDPDLYFVGFLLSPVVTPNGQVQVVNEIGSFFTIDVPGPRVRKLIGDLQINPSVIAHIRLPSIVIGSRAHGLLHVRNVGPTEVRFWGEVDSSSTGSAAGQDRIDKSLIPRGHVRTFTVVGKPVWPIDFVKLTARVFYPGQTETSTQEIDLSKSVLVISPWVIVAAIVLLVAGVWYWRRRRKRRRPPSGKNRRNPRPISPGTPAERRSFGFRRAKKAPGEKPERVSEPVSGGR